MGTATVLCGECQAPMALRTSRFGKFWGCTRFPDCKGTHGAHPDGRPLGLPANAETKEARMRAHRAFDGLWMNQGWTRRQGYQWLQNALGLKPDEAHIANFTVEQCERLIKEVCAFQG
jgi:ssDNA-binding Zn-finger/Zn-ribbon topoisomerase 1